ncbi:MAG: hypothetical protein HFE97_01645 [Oscillospiraceae bacterium]|nr:hypothetical protein [Oscillospiraceae bacterium]
MKRKMGSVRSFISGALCMLLVVGLVTSAAAYTGQKTAALDYSDIKVVLDGTVLKLTDGTGATVEPFAINGTTYLPVRAISKALGLEVEWNASSHTVYLKTSSENFTPSDGERVDMATLKPYTIQYKDDDGSASFRQGSSFTNRQTQYHPDNYLSMAAGSSVLGWTQNKVPSFMSVTYLTGGDYKAFTAYAASRDGLGTASFRFYDADTNTLLKEVTVKEGDAPVQISFDMTGVDKLRITLSTYYTSIGISVYNRVYNNGALYNAYLIKK